jgi:Transposase DDE domain
VTRPTWLYLSRKPFGNTLAPTAALADWDRSALSFVYGRASTSEHRLIPKLISYLKKGDLLLFDAGFYSFATLAKITDRAVQFIVPAKKDLRPEALRKVGDGDYLCRIKDYRSEKTITVRVVFVHRNGFRRRRLITSLLDPVLFPSSDLALLYHLRWDIETFYRDFKCALNATRWHCQTPESFQRELLMHMIVCCLIRIAMLNACRRVGLAIGELSFARALTETRLFLKLVLTEAGSWTAIWATYVLSCAKFPVRYRPNRQYSRDRQQYRRKARGLETRRKKTGRKYQEPSPMPMPETRKNAKGQVILLS